MSFTNKKSIICILLSLGNVLLWNSFTSLPGKRIYSFFLNRVETKGKIKLFEEGC